jgi:hypothetical protein
MEFTKITLPSGIKATVMEAKGKHYFFAVSKSQGDLGELIKYLINQLIVVEDKNLSIEEIEEMDLSDISYLSEVISIMLQKPIIF